MSIAEELDQLEYLIQHINETIKEDEHKAEQILELDVFKKVIERIRSHSRTEGVDDFLADLEEQRYRRIAAHS